MLQLLAIKNYRTLRELVIELGPLNLVTGPNGSGKSNIYKALRLLAETAQGGVVASIAREGGLESTLWASVETFTPAMLRGEAPVQGTRRTEPVSLALGFVGTDFSYSIDLGLPLPVPATAFTHDPVIKGEYVWAGPTPRPSAMLVERRNAMVRSRGDDGDWQLTHDQLSSFDSMLAAPIDASRTPELVALRDRIRSWRFYDHFRTDALAPSRLPQIGTHTPRLGHDGSDLAAALQTIREIGDGEALDQAVEDAFPGARVEIDRSGGRFETTMIQEGLLRPLRAMELSDGTLRYLLWIAALLSPRPPDLLVLNEPETSLHPDLLPALGRLIAQASRRSQVFVVSHATRLVAALQEQDDCHSFELEKVLGATQVRGRGRFDQPNWKWISRA
ncbi:AAA family ATPase [soil metagenome]